MIYTTMSDHKFDTSDCAGILEVTGEQALRLAARALLDRLSVITTEEFERGGEREERRALALALGLDPAHYSL